MSPMSARLNMMMLVFGAILIAAVIIIGMLQGRPRVAFRAAGLMLLPWLAIYAFYRFVGVPSLTVLILATLGLATMSFWAVLKSGIGGDPNS